MLSGNCAEVKATRAQGAEQADRTDVRAVWSVIRVRGSDCLRLPEGSYQRLSVETSARALSPSTAFEKK